MAGSTCVRYMTSIIEFLLKLWLLWCWRNAANIGATPHLKVPSKTKNPQFAQRLLLCIFKHFRKQNKTIGEKRKMSRIDSGRAE